MASALVHTRESPGHDSPHGTVPLHPLKCRPGLGRVWSYWSHDVLRLVLSPGSRVTEDQRVSPSLVILC